MFSVTRPNHYPTYVHPFSSSIKIELVDPSVSVSGFVRFYCLRVHTSLFMFEVKTLQLKKL